MILLAVDSLDQESIMRTTFDSPFGRSHFLKLPFDQEGESVGKFLAALIILMKTCQYCPRCETSLIRDHIILGIRSNDIRENMLKVRYLALDKCIDFCIASETAASHSDAFVPDNAIRVLDGKQRDDTKECNFC